MIIVAFGHRSRVGKDTCGKFLDSALRTAGIRAKRVSFAAKLKEVSYIAYSWAGLRQGAYYETEEGAKARQVKLPALGLTPVEVWVEVGNKFREIFMDTWLNATLLADYPNIDVIIITDLRFPNEGDKIVDLGGWPNKVTNSRAPVLDTVSDKALEGWTGWWGTLNNEGTLQDLNALTDDLAAKVIERVRNGQ